MRLSQLSSPLAHHQIIFLVYPAMEDAHTAVLTLEDGTKEKNAFFGVYDGHGGIFSPLVSVFTLTPHSQAAPLLNSPEKTSISAFLQKKHIARSVMPRR